MGKSQYFLNHNINEEEALVKSEVRVIRHISYRVEVSSSVTDQNGKVNSDQNVTILCDLMNFNSGNFKVARN